MISCGTKGAIGELRVGADLLSRGYEVFRSVSQCCTCDLIAMRDGKMWRVEVRSLLTMKNLECRKPRASDRGKQDIFAWVLPDTIVYTPDLPY